MTQVAGGKMQFGGRECGDEVMINERRQGIGRVLKWGRAGGRRVVVHIG
jgi:hypothetical protein